MLSEQTPKTTRQMNCFAWLPAWSRASEHPLGAAIVEAAKARIFC